MNGGREAAAQVHQLVNGLLVSCDLDGTITRDNRPFGVCNLGEADIGEIMVREGLLDYAISELRKNSACGGLSPGHPSGSVASVDDASAETIARTMAQRGS